MIRYVRVIAGCSLLGVVTASVALSWMAGVDDHALHEIGALGGALAAVVLLPPK